MLLGSITKLTSSLLGGIGLPANAAPQAQANAAAKAASESAGSTPGVIFDLSEAAQQAVAAAAPDSGATAPANTMAVPQSPPPFLPAAMTIAAEIAAVNAPQPTEPQASQASAQSPAASNAASVSAAASNAVSVSAAASARAEASDAPAATSSSVQATADPDEEARARAFAIQAQDRNQLLSLADRLSEAKADSVATLTAPAKDVPSDGKSAAAAA